MSSMSLSPVNVCTHSSVRPVTTSFFHTHGERQPRRTAIHPLHIFIRSKEGDLPALCIAIRFQAFKERTAIMQDCRARIKQQRGIRANLRVSPACTLGPRDGEHVICECMPELEGAGIWNLFWRCGRKYFKSCGLAVHASLQLRAWTQGKGYTYVYIAAGRRLDMLQVWYLALRLQALFLQHGLLCQTSILAAPGSSVQRSCSSICRNPD